MELTLIFLAGVCIGVSITTIIFRTFLVGALRIDTSDPNDNPYIFLELSKGMDTVTSKKYVILKVNLKSFNPRK